MGKERDMTGLVRPRDIEELQEAFIRCHDLERREPGNGRWPFAGDAPWHLMQREVEAGDYCGDGQDGVGSSVAPRPPLSAAEVGELATLRSWLLLVPEATGKGMAVDHDRKLVWVASGRLAQGDVADGGRVPWKAVGRWIGSPRHPVTLAERYRVALATVVCLLNTWPVARARRMAA